MLGPRRQSRLHAKGAKGLTEPQSHGGSILSPQVYLIDGTRTRARTRARARARTRARARDRHAVLKPYLRGVFTVQMRERAKTQRRKAEM